MNEYLTIDFNEICLESVKVFKFYEIYNFFDCAMYHKWTLLLKDAEFTLFSQVNVALWIYEYILEQKRGNIVEI